jgi:hypothetical protein
VTFSISGLRRFHKFAKIQEKIWKLCNIIFEKMHFSAKFSKKNKKIIFHEKCNFAHFFSVFAVSGLFSPERA